jgi:cytochrome-b5 reductase
MISIIRWIVVKGLDAELSLVFANKTEADIIFRDEWEAHAREHANFHVHHVLEHPPSGWTQGSGRITAEILRGHLPAPAADTAVFLCGPPMMVDTLEGTLKDIGYSEPSIILP